MITIEDLEKIGIVRLKPEIYPYTFFIPYVGDVRLDLDNVHSWSYIYELIYAKGYKNGVEAGEKTRSEAIKKLLDIE